MRAFQPCRRLRLAGFVTAAAAALLVVAGSAAAARAPHAPVGVRVIARGPHSLVVAWRKPAGSIARYSVAVKRGRSSRAKAISTRSTRIRVSSLACGSTYTLSVASVSTDGTRSRGARKQAQTTSCADTTAPSAPTDVRVTAALAAGVSLTWTAATDDVAVSRYQVVVDGVVRATTTTTSATATVGCGYSGSATVRAEDAAGNGTASAPVAIATQACADTTPPSAPTAVHETGSTGSSYTLAWTAATDGTGVAGYTVSVGGSTVAQTSGTSATVTGAACGWSGQAVVSAADAAGNTTAAAPVAVSTQACADTTAPSLPGSVHQTGSTASSYTLGWVASSDDVGVAGYTVSVGGSTVAQTTGTSATVAGLVCGWSGAATVTARDAAGNTTAAAPVAVSTQACADTTAPSLPGSVHQTGSTASSYTLAWAASTDDVGVAGYTVSVGGSTVAQTSGTSATVTGAACGWSGQAVVSAADAAGNTTAAAPVAVSTQACADTTAPSLPGSVHQTGSTASSYTLGWVASSDDVGVAGYTVSVGGSTVAQTTGTSATVAGLVCGWSGAATVTARDAAGNTTAAAPVAVSTQACADTTAPSLPGSVHQTGSTASSYTLAWAASTDDVGVAGYTVTVGGSTVAQTTGTSATVAGLVCGWSGAATVTARDAAGNSAAAAAVAVSTQACPDTTPPTAPGNLAQSAATTSSVTVTWSASTDAVGVTGYSITRDGNAAGSVGASVRTATVSGLACGTSVTVGVTATDAAGNASPNALVSARTADCTTSGAADVFVATNGSDSAACTAAAPCKSFDRAYKVARAGQTVQIAAGTYSGQTINADTSKTSTDDVTFTVAPGATVATGDLTINGKHVTLDGFTVNGDWSTGATTDDVTFRNLTVKGGIFITSSSNISVIGGSVGPLVDAHPQFASWPVGTHISNILVDGVTFHDMSRTSDSVHTECLQIAGGVGITVRRSVFEACAVLDLSFTEYNGSGPPTDVLVENNVFGSSTSGGYNSFHLNTNATDFRNFEIRYNSSTQAFALTGLQKVTNVKVVANVAPNVAWGCMSGISYARNVWDGAKCGTTDKNAKASFVDAASLDLRLAAGSAAIDAGDASDYPSTDITGRARPLGGAPDAGAYEAG